MSRAPTLTSMTLRVKPVLLVPVPLGGSPEMLRQMRPRFPAHRLESGEPRAKRQPIPSSPQREALRREARRPPMLKRLKAVALALIVLAWPAPGIADCVEDGIATSVYHTCAFVRGNSAMCWGTKDFEGMFAPVPAPVTDPSGSPVTIDSSAQPTAADRGVATGESHSCAISEPNRSSVCWGDDALGQLGDGNSAQSCPPGRPSYTCESPVAVPVVTASGALLSGVISLAAGGGFSCALNDGGNVQCWGGNGAGELGDGQSSRAEPFRANPNDLTSTILTGPAIAIAAGLAHACAVMQDTTVRCWGNNSHGQLGTAAASPPSSNTPVTVMTGTPPNTAPLTNAVAIAAGESFTCALISDGTAACWGFTANGQLGRSPDSCPFPPGFGSGIGSGCPVAQPVLDASGNSLTGIQEIAGGNYHACAVMNGGTVECWGDNPGGQLGPAAPAGGVSVPPVTVAVASCDPVNGPACTPLTGVAHIAAGWDHTCASLSAGGVRCWGANTFGQLGTNAVPNTQSAVPVAVVGLCNCPGFQYCNGQCTDTTSDAQNCSGCNISCTGGACVASACHCPPAAPTLCQASASSQVCADLTSDANNCNMCGHACSTGEICSNSTCVCSPGLTSCNDRCVDLQFDNNNCGRCGVHCRVNPPCNREESGCTTCENGECVPF